MPSINRLPLNYRRALALPAPYEVLTKTGNAYQDKVRVLCFLEEYAPGTSYSVYEL